jgi:hypothetical protein
MSCVHLVRISFLTMAFLPTRAGVHASRSRLDFDEGNMLSMHQPALVQGPLRAQMRCEVEHCETLRRVRRPGHCGAVVMRALQNEHGEILAFLIGVGSCTSADQALAEPTQTSAGIHSARTGAARYSVDAIPQQCCACTQ